jgi:16S rRNA processing protein RimM
LKNSHRIPEPYISIGLIVKPWGLNGAVIVFPEGSHLNRFRKLKKVTLVSQGAVIKILDVQSVLEKTSGLIVKFKQIHEIDEAEGLRGTYICVDESEAIQLNPWEFFQHELIGLTVQTQTGRNLGQVKQILETGANDVYVVHGADGKELLIPAIREIIKEVNLEHRIMLIDPFEGMLE